MTSIRYVITQPLLSGLAGLLPGEKSVLSPLRSANPPQLTPEQTLLLENAEILSAENTFCEPARQVLTVLSEIVSFARVRASTPSGYVDQSVHFSAGGAQTVVLANQADGLTLSAPADAEAILAEVSDLIGSAQRTPPAWSALLPPTEMLALVALMDLRRRAVLRSLADQRPVVPPPSDPAAIARAIEEMSANPQWLTAAVQSAASLAALSAAQVQSALTALVDKKLAWPHGESFLPVPEAIQVADRFVLINTFLSLDAGSSNHQGRSALTHQAWLGAGAGEVLHLLPEQDQLRLEVVSPRAALDQIRVFLTQFNALPAPALERVPLALVIQNGINTGKVYPLNEETVLGRSEQADIHLLDSRASRRHSVVRKLPEGYMLNDAGSTNGTFLNNHAVTTATPLAEDDIILIGETQLKVVRAGATPPPVSENTPTLYVGDAIRMAGEMPPPPTPAASFTPNVVNIEPAAPPVVPFTPNVVKIEPPAPAAPYTPNVVKIEPSAPAAPYTPNVVKIEPSAPAAPYTPNVVKIEPSAPAAPYTPNVVKIEPAAPTPAPYTPNVVKIEPSAPAAPFTSNVIRIEPAAPPPPPAQGSPETGSRFFVPPPPPVKPPPVIPPPPVLTPAPYNAPPSGVPARPATVKPLRCERCNEPLAADDLVCTHCGQPVGQPVVTTRPVLPQTLAVCPKCFSPIELNAHFCGTCGNKLG